MRLNEVIRRLKERLASAKGDSIVRKRLVQAKKRTEAKLDKARVDSNVKKYLVRDKKRIEAKLDKARVDSDVKKYLVRSKKRMGDQLARSKAEVKRLKSNNKRLTSRLAVAVSPKPGPSSSAYTGFSRSGKWRRSQTLVMAVPEEDADQTAGKFSGFPLVFPLLFPLDSP